MPGSKTGGQETSRSAPRGEMRVKAVTGTVASLRLDTVASLGFGMSRTAVAEEIRRGRVRVNGAARLDPSFAVKPADVMTLEGRGSVTLVGVAGETRKGRTLVNLQREVADRQ